MKFKKKPVVIEAFRYYGELRSGGEHPAPYWIRDNIVNDTLHYEGEELFIKTLEGDMRVSVGDYIIKGVHDELYPCKPDIFEKTYEPCNPYDTPL